ncbi:DUF4398 domain-containing protein [Stutzerimonas urumqiensis]|uniref:DUF4398 domain-containing protein n=1 Tax=Stutzerimonas urumqiensis TaxID=638269 RepID=UPI000EB4C559|nr:DUF4398 domain-containing protein [Stutzerimonas urumqiensis]
MNHRNALFLLTACTLLVACATDPVPDEQLRLTRQAIEQAEAVGGTDEVAELALARNKTAQAEAAVQDGDNKRARLLAEQAELDARLAEAKVLTQKSDEQIAELTRRIARLRQQLGDLQ